MSLGTETYYRVVFDLIEGQPLDVPIEFFVFANEDGRFGQPQDFIEFVENGEGQKDPANFNIPPLVIITFFWFAIFTFGPFPIFNASNPPWQIKIPGTEAGIPAIRKMINEGADEAAAEAGVGVPAGCAHVARAHADELEHLRVVGRVREVGGVPGVHAEHDRAALGHPRRIPR